ncbi:hypothetical protein PIB30_035617 [Stylosanthes scabra]|uniref:Putative plant transposon protein domain-containing protein n=1 Tax=Stylosanthes scabra TaxID=79078 RepID=A0ABU6YFK7_9FABA|nr:hypothetical protein [Stylosanthes scabra]
MARKGKEIAATSTPSRACKTKKSSRGRENEYPEERFDSRDHYERSRTLEGRGITHERIINFSDGDEDFMADRVQGLGWGFMYNGFIPINLRGKKIHFSENAIGRHLHIPYELPPVGEDNIFKKTVTVYNEGNLDMSGVLEVIGREGITWANDPAIMAIPKKMDNDILNAKATAWHKLIMANIDPKTHATTFLMEHALLIFVLMTEGIVNLPRIMRDVALKRPTANTRNLLPYPMFIARVANQYQVPEFARDEIVKIREVYMYCSYGDWKGEQPKVRRARILPAAQAPPVLPPEKHSPSPQPQPSATKISSASVRSSSEPLLKEVMRYLRRQECLQVNTQPMLYEAFSEKRFTCLIPVSSTDDDSDAES